MLLLDFINVGNGDAALIRETENGQTIWSMLIDCGHDLLLRPDEKSKRIYAADFLKEQGIGTLDLLAVTHLHRDHIGGLSRILQQVRVREMLAPYFPPAGTKGVPQKLAAADFPRPMKNLLLCLDLFCRPVENFRDRIGTKTLLAGTQTAVFSLTPALRMTVMFGEPVLYERQRQIFDAALAGEADRYTLLHWGKCMNLSSLRIRLSYHGTDIVFGGDAYAVSWDMDMLSPCRILKVPHHASLSSVNRSFLRALSPETAVVSVASDRADERPHPAVIALLREYAKQVYFTDAVDLPGLVRPLYHESVHLKIE